MLRIEVSEDGEGGATLPAVDIADASFVIGSGTGARVRLPADVAHAEHVRISDGTRFRTVDGAEGDIGDGVALEIGRYKIRITPAPAGSTASPPQRTESLARELMRNLLGGNAAPSFEVERGPIVGAKHKLAPPESTLIIGRGDEANWIILDEDLSRTHAEVRRGWDGTRIADLGSKNSTKVDGVKVGGDGAALRDGALVELGKVVLRFHDPAERQLAAPSAPMATAVASPAAVHRARDAAPGAPTDVARAPAPPSPSTLPFFAALVIMVAALVGLVWVVSL